MSKDNTEQENNTLNEQDKAISQLYHKGEKPMPSSQVDEAILAMATQELQAFSEQHVAARKQKKLWQKWPVAGSLAASLIIAAITISTTRYHVPDISPSHLTSTESPAAAPESRALPAEALTGLNLRDEDAVVQEQKLVMTDRLNEEAEELAVAVKQQAQEQASKALRARSAVQKKEREIPLAEKIEKQYLSLLAITSTSQEANTEKAQLQARLYQNLLLQKSNSETWSLKPKYKKVLTEKQITALTRSSTLDKDN